MAARRLIAVLIVLLVISSVAAALAPQRQRSGPDTSTGTSATTTTTAPSRSAGNGPRGRLLRQRVPAEPRQPVQVDARVGDELRLTVEVARPTPVQIPGLGLSGFGYPGTPARFDLLLRGIGTYAVTVGAGRAVAQIQVSS